MDFLNNSANREQMERRAAKKPTLYDLLEVPSDATRIQVRESYIRLKNTYSSGSGALYSLISEADVQQNIAGLEEAYRVLSDDLLRRDYDDGLLQPAVNVEEEYSCDDPFGENHMTSVNRQSEEPLATKSFEVSRPATSEAEVSQEPAAVVRKSATSHRYAETARKEAIQRQIAERVAVGQFDGSLLKDLREIQSVSLDELQARTKVSLQYIIALENNDFKNLPSVVYVKGFLKICLQYLGLQKDLDQIVCKYLEFLKHWQENKTSSTS